MDEGTNCFCAVCRGLHLTEPGLTASRQVVAGGWRNPKPCCGSKHIIKMPISWISNGSQLLTIIMVNDLNNLASCIQAKKWNIVILYSYNYQEFI